MSRYFIYNGLDYEAFLWVLGFNQYEVDVIFVGTQDPNVGSEVQRYAEDLFEAERFNRRHNVK